MNIGSSDLGLLVAFEALFAELHVTRAARRLGITQPAMSNALRRLRALLGDPLFVRTSDGMSPTPRAIALAPTIEAALGSLRQVISATGFDPLHSAARFVIGTLDYLEALSFPGLIAHMGEVAPGVSLQIRRLESIFELPQAQLESGAIDCALGLFPLPLAPQTSLFGQILGAEAWVCIARPGHPGLARPLTVEAYAGLKHLAISYPGTGWGGLIDRRLAEHGLTRTCVATGPHFTTLPFHVAASDCIATLPRRLAVVFARLAPLEIVELPLDLPAVSVSLIWHARVDGDPAHRWFRQMVAECVGREF